MLSDGRRRDLREAEEHHVADDFDLIRVVCQPHQDMRNEFSQVYLRQASVELEENG